MAARFAYIILGEKERRKNKPKQYQDPDNTPFLRGLSNFEQDIELFKRYRFTNDGLNYLMDLVRDQVVAAQSGRGNPVPLELQVKLTLQYLASNDLQNNICRQFGLHQSTVSRCILRVCHALSAKAGDFIFLPTDVETIRKMKQDFYNYSRFPSIIGAIDGTQVRIEPPPGETAAGGTIERSYVNRKGFHAINVLALCDFSCRFLYVNASWPGSAHDAYILRQSELWDFMESGNLRDAIILGDSAFPIRDWLMTPFPNPNGAAQKAYNYAHAKARVRIEHTFGQYKRKWRINNSSNRRALQEIPATIIATAVLHNIGINLKLPQIHAEENEDLGLDVPMAADDENDPTQSPPRDRRAQQTERVKRQLGNNKRNEITNVHFA